jgi:hypothetical protein
MAKTLRRVKVPSAGGDRFAVERRKIVPHEFVLDAIAAPSPETRTMFGCLAVCVGAKVVLRLPPGEFPNMRSIEMLGKMVTGWQVLTVDAPDF